MTDNRLTPLERVSPLIDPDRIDRTAPPAGLTLVHCSVCRRAATWAATSAAPRALVGLCCDSSGGGE